jgi:hypothetical protein
MTDRQFAGVLVREGIRQAGAPAAPPATYPMTTRPEPQIAELLPRIAAIRADLAGGQVEAAIRDAQGISGKSARTGDRRTASLLRQAVCMARFYVLEQAGELVAQAERELAAGGASH